MNLYSGDKYTGHRWRTYYEIDMDQNKYAIPKFGLFTPGTIVGVLVDMDRGAINFFKDGNDLGPAFVAPHIKDGEMFPFVHT